MNKKGIKTVGTLALILIVLAGAVGAYLISEGEMPFAVSGQNYDPDYTSIRDGSVYTKVFGTVDCRPVPGAGETKDAKYQGFNDRDYGTLTFSCPSTAGTNCKIDSISGFMCDDSSSRNTQKQYRVSGTNDWNTYTGTVALGEISPGSTKTFDFRCRYYIGNTEYGYSVSCSSVDFAFFSGLAQDCDSESNIFSTYKVPISKLYVDSQGYTRGGWIPGTEGCDIFKANDIREIEDLQEKGESVPSVPFGVTKNIVVGWREVSGRYTINPLGTFDGKDVMCKPFDGIYEVDSTQLQGGKQIYQEGSLLTSWISGQNCCSNEECNFNAVCENYECKAPEEAKCEFGECAWYDEGNVLSQTCEETSFGKFELITQSCEDGCLKEERESVKCCPDSCLSDEVCIYDKGCQPYGTEQDCPDGFCCEPGNEVSMKEQSCSGDKECCLEADARLGIGLCLDSCDIVAVPETCGNGVCDSGESEDNCPEDCIETDECSQQCYADYGSKQQKTKILGLTVFEGEDTGSPILLGTCLSYCKIKTLNFMAIGIGTIIAVLVGAVFTVTNKKYIKMDKTIAKILTVVLAIGAFITTLALI